MEHADALDLLNCIAELGVTGDEANGIDIASTLEELRALTNSTGDRKESLTKTIELLGRSYEYSREMRRASLSARCWLQSIGKSKLNSMSDATISLFDPNDLSGKVTPAVLKAMWHSSQNEVIEKTKLADRLNEELAECRAEIGRLKSAAHVSSFTTVNQSMFDIENEEESDVGEGNYGPRTSDAKLEHQGDYLEASNILDVSINKDANCEFALESEPSTSLRIALDEANETIDRLGKECESLKAKVSRDSEYTSSESAILSSANDQQNGEDWKYCDNAVSLWQELIEPLPPPPDHALRSPIVQAVLEEWTDDRQLHEALLSWIEGVVFGGNFSSAPPLTIAGVEHHVKDGLITHVVPMLLRRRNTKVDVQTRVRRQTTYDIGVSVELLDGQSDQTVEIRQNLEDTSTKSDVGGFGTHGTKSTYGLQLNADAPMRIGSVNYRRRDDTGPLYDEVAEGVEQQDQIPGIMSVLGDALGVFMTRRKAAIETSPEVVSVVRRDASPRGLLQTPLESKGASTGIDTIAAAERNMAAVTAGPPAVASDPQQTEDKNDDAAAPVVSQDDEEPYHRVLSCPPGRIGVTFVEFRGHAMVSDVAHDSPLHGWIHPSDVLLAVDERTVVGMKVRDIIKLLRDRSERQRALRVISGHAMNEVFSLHDVSAIVD
jgi:hypothetical protein